MTAIALATSLIAAAPAAAGVCGRSQRLALVMSAGLLGGGCVCLALAGTMALSTNVTQEIIALSLPVIGPFTFEMTPVAGLFLLVSTSVFAAALAFVLSDSAAYAPAHRTAFLALIALTLTAMTGVFVAADVVSFIVCWEIAALAIWGLVVFDTHCHESVTAGMLTLALSELGSMTGLAGLLLLAIAVGTPRLAGIAAAVPSLSPALVSEWLTLESLLRVVEIGPMSVCITFALSGAALALTAGLARLQPEMAYSATAFAAPVRVLFNAMFSPVVASREQRQGAFITASQHRELLSNVVERLVLRPVAIGSWIAANGLTRLHRGQVTGYAAYVLLVLLITLLVAMWLL